MGSRVGTRVRQERQPEHTSEVDPLLGANSVHGLEGRLPEPASPFNLPDGPALLRVCCVLGWLRLEGWGLNPG